MRLAQITKTINGETSIWDSEQRRFIRGGVTLDAARISADENGKKIVRAGEILGKAASTGKYEPITNAVAASKETGVIADNNRILWTAREKGIGGNGIKVAIVDPSANSAALAVTIDGDTIKVSVATSGVGAITSTAADVIAAVAAHLVASDFVIASNVTGFTGAGVVAAVAAGALSGGADWVVVPSCMLAHDVDCTDGDIGAGAVDMARVKGARLPRAITSEVAALLPGITVV
jgi:hypothetical protein